MRVVPAPSVAKKQTALSVHIQLIRALSEDIDRGVVQKIFSDSRLQLDRSVIAKEGGQYVPSTLLTPESVERGKEFIKRVSHSKKDFLQEC